jgi:hypothetical protein
MRTGPMSQSGQKWFPDPPDVNVRAARIFFWTIYLCGFQMILMFSFTFFFLSSENVTAELYRQLDWLGEYSPLLLKYRNATAGTKAPFDLAVVFSIYFSYLAVQAVVVPGILLLFFKSLPSRPRFDFSKENVALLTVALLVLVIPLWEVLVGPSDIRNADVYSNRIYYGGVGSAFVEYCIVMPSANFTFFLLMFTVSRNRR